MSVSVSDGGGRMSASSSVHNLLELASTDSSSGNPQAMKKSPSQQDFLQQARRRSTLRRGSVKHGGDPHHHERRVVIVQPRDDTDEAKPFEVVAIAGQGRVSKTDVPHRYHPDTLLDDVLDSCESVTVGRTGICDLQGQDINYMVDASRLTPANIDFCLYEWESHRDQLYSISLCDSKSLDIVHVERLVVAICARGFYRYLVELNLSYVAISQKSLDSLCFYVDPVTAGYCPVRRLILAHAQLGSQGSQDLFRALTQNVVLEELHLTGNGATDASGPALVKFLDYGANLVNTLHIGDNQFTAATVKQLAALLPGHRYLKELQINSNPIGDAGADALVEGIRDRDVFDSLAMNDCGLVDCQWAGRLRVVACLSHLYLAHNKIDDYGLQILAGGLEACGCIRYLDLSYNAFTGSLSSGGLGDLVKNSKVLTTLIVAGNIMPMSTWTMVSAGLLENTSLQRFDCTWCDLAIPSAEALCRALEVNDVCTVDMRFNNLPEIMLLDPRRYKNPKKGPQHVEPIPLATRPQALSLKNSQAWRVHRVDEVKAAKVAYRIVQKQEAFTQKAIEEQKARDEALGDVEDGQDDSSSLFHASSLGLSGASKGGPSDADSFGVLSFDLSASAFGPPSTGSSMEPTGESVNMSVGAHRQKALHRFKKKDDAYAKAIGGKRILAVAYGHITTILGSINVSDNTTYAEAKELIKPLVAAYCGGETGRKKPPPPAYESSVSSADVAAAQGLDAAERRKAQRAFLREKKKEEAAWTSAQAPPPAAPAALTSAGKVDDTSWVDGGDGAGEDVDYGDTAKPLRNYAEDFTLLRPSGEPIDPVVARVRPVWIEASAKNYTIVVRPAGWISISRGPPERDLDEESGQQIVSQLHTPRSEMGYY